MILMEHNILGTLIRCEIVYIPRERWHKVHVEFRNPNVKLPYVNISR